MDFFGPFRMKAAIRSKSTCKAYGCVFICMATKAIHCELVESLSTESFINAFRRFINRRGLPSDVYCDNGTNFIGASNSLKEVYSYLENDKVMVLFHEELKRNRIQWHFNPPNAPNFGGLWEAAVKSVKTHVFKTISDTPLLFVEMYTLLSEIESILNSRPLTTLSNDPNDLDFLTPGHFLVGQNLKSLPAKNMEPIPTNRLNRWELVQHLQQRFWKHWHLDYLQNLQKRQKWTHSTGRNIEVGQLVIIQDNNTPSRIWKTGRVQQLHPGADGVVRTVTLKTSGGSLKRAVNRLCALPVD